MQFTIHNKIIKKIKTIWLILISITTLIFKIKKIRTSLKFSEIIFFFPFYHTGGAEKVHLDIVRAYENFNIVVFFNLKSKNEANLTHFLQSATIFDLAMEFNYIPKIINLVLIYFINKNHKLRLIFGSNSVPFYDIIQNITNNSLKIDLIHAFSKPDWGIENYSIRFVEKLNYRIVINQRTKKDLINQYADYKLDRYVSNIEVISNALHKDILTPHKIYDGTLKILFVGRGAPEKRIHLINKIASYFESTSSIEFIMIGNDLEKYIDKRIKNIKIIGEIIIPSDLNNFYSNAHLLLITSYREGFPIVVMEGLIHGVTPICTNVGGISEYIRHNENGFLVNNNTNERQIVFEFIRIINHLQNNRPRLKKINNKSYEFAVENFDIAVFNEKYLSLLTK